MKKHSKKFNIILTVLLAIGDLIAIGCFVLFYGTKFKVTFISTAMNTMEHQYLARVFYSEKTINKIMRTNYFVELDTDANLDDIVIDTSIKTTFKDKYEEELLTRKEGDLYKLINLKVGSANGYLVAIYDPTKVQLISKQVLGTSTGERIITMCERYGGSVCINGGGFLDPDGWGSDIPQGYIIKNNEVVWSDSTDQNDIIGITNDNKLMLVHATGEEAIKMGIRDGLQFGPFLIVNGEVIQFNDAAGGYNKAARTAIAQRKDGVILFLVTEGVHANGPKLLSVAEFLKKYGAYNAANLDGGSSSQLVIKGKLINRPLNVAGQEIKGGRGVVSGFILMP